MTVSASARHKARHFAMQAIYQWQMSGAAINDIEAEFHTDNDMSKADVTYFNDLLHGVAKRADELGEYFAPHLQDRAIHELDPITLALLRLASYEFKYRADVPYKVVINEAVSLAKKFGATDSHKFVNAVLDRLAHILRAVEVEATKRYQGT